MLLPGAVLGFALWAAAGLPCHPDLIYGGGLVGTSSTSLGPKWGPHEGDLPWPPYNRFWMLRLQFRCEVRHSLTMTALQLLRVSRLSVRLVVCLNSPR